MGKIFNNSSDFLVCIHSKLKDHCDNEQRKCGIQITHVIYWAAAFHRPYFLHHIQFYSRDGPIPYFLPIHWLRLGFADTETNVPKLRQYADIEKKVPICQYCPYICTANKCLKNKNLSSECKN